MQLVKPAIGGVTSQHGEDIGRGFPHVGTDLGHGDGQPADLRVVAPAAGKVTTARAIGTYGNCLVILHDDGSWTRLAHLAEFLVTVGQRVEQGQDVGVMGNTGTKYVHLHWEYHLADGTAVNPLKYLGTSAATKGIDMPKVISVPKGTIAFVSETFGKKYTDPNDFSLAANRLTYGEVSGLTEDVVTTMVNEANHRGALLADAVAARVKR